LSLYRAVVLDTPEIFLHFLDQRIKAADDPEFEVSDELDYLGLYLAGISHIALYILAQLRY